jgi:hypothetical protein
MQNPPEQQEIIEFARAHRGAIPLSVWLLELQAVGGAMGEAQVGGCYEDGWASEEAAARFNGWRWRTGGGKGVRDRRGATEVRAGLAARFGWRRQGERRGWDKWDASGWMGTTRAAGWDWGIEC